ncbi:hypothetical protein [Neptunomonas antarctica]|uniref:Uncharacterized protein n=1 Tax=Neptunomonas antarctica TaxID=619304 RepID=A0A1N7NY79_9GAMM|nr:hypothetical protein [Neptunomonas antarctica]SIT03293.1 hypothetical protein SAMN05421760_111148 [Neptunomonas antarctica]
MRYFVLILVSILSFAAGAFWFKWQLLESKPVSLTQTLSVQSSSDNIGVLPKGTILYPYSDGPDIETYILFVNSKYLNAIEAVGFENIMTVAPLDGYSE